MVPLSAVKIRKFPYQHCLKVGLLIPQAQAIFLQLAIYMDARPAHLPCNQQSLLAYAQGKLSVITARAQPNQLLPLLSRLCRC